jgi:hypothetical protein
VSPGQADGRRPRGLPNESLQLEERRSAPRRQHGSNPAAPQLNSGVRQTTHIT